MILEQFKFENEFEQKKTTRLITKFFSDLCMITTPQ